MGEEKIEIPEKFKALVHDIAEFIDSGYVCYLNPDTMKYKEIPCEFYDNLYLEDDKGIWQKEVEKIDNWDKKILIKPLESHESFKIMKCFVDKIPDDRLKNKLWNALERNRPFANFKKLIDYSNFRQDWFKFKNYVSKNMYIIFCRKKMFLLIKIQTNKK